MLFPVVGTRLVVGYVADCKVGLRFSRAVRRRDAGAPIRADARAPMPGESNRMAVLAGVADTLAYIVYLLFVLLPTVVFGYAIWALIAHIVRPNRRSRPAAETTKTHPRWELRSSDLDWRNTLSVLAVANCR